MPDYDFEDDPDQCPRDRTEAIAHGRNCLRKCKNDQDCISTRKRCLCDGLCGWSCIRPGKNAIIDKKQIVNCDFFLVFRN